MKAHQNVPLATAHYQHYADKEALLADALDGLALKAFRALYPKGQNYLVTPSANEAYQIRKSDMDITVCDLGSLLGLL